MTSARAPRRWKRGLALAVLAMLGCGPDKGPTGWISERAAVVQCTNAGHHRMPPALVGLPIPRVPTGLYARAMDPLALDELGFERERVACAVLEVPPEEEIASMRSGILALLEDRETASRRARAEAVGCTCDVARGLSLEALVIGCASTPTAPECDPSQGRSRVEAALAPLVDAIALAPLPVVHWRLVGRTDRPGWFVERGERLLARHPGGSTIYRRGEAVPRRGNGELLARILQEDGVVAVVRQDGGRAFLVVRELGRVLVLDHFAHPFVNGEVAGLLAAIDDAHVDAYVERLRAPETTRTLAFGPAGGNMVEIDRLRLQDVDRIIDAALAFTDEPTGPSRETEALVDRIAVQAPFGHAGERLRIRLELSGAGQEWAGTLTNERLSPTLEELGLPIDLAVHAGVPDAWPYVLRGTATEAELVHGLAAAAWVFRKVEMQHPSTVHGTARAWRFDLPVSDLSPVFAPAGESLPFSGLRGLMSTKPYVLTAELDRGKARLSLEVVPRSSM